MTTHKPRPHTRLPRTLAALAGFACMHLALATQPTPPAPPSPPSPPAQPTTPAPSPSPSTPTPLLSTAGLKVDLPPCPPNRSRELWALMDDYVLTSFLLSPISASSAGFSAFDALLPNASPQMTKARYESTRTMLARLRALDRASFSEEDALDADLLEFNLTQTLEGEKFELDQMPVTAIDGPHIWIPQIPQQSPVRTPAQKAAYLQRLRGIAPLIDQYIEQMKLGLAEGRTQPKAVLRGTVAMVRTQARDELSANPALSPLFQPFAAPGSDEAAKKQAAEARTLIAEQITPAFARFADFLENQYIPACRDALGASQSVDGPALYDYLLKVHTTTDLSAEEIHQIGLREVARLKAEMMTVIDRTDFRARTPSAQSLEGKPLFDAFVNDLRTNERFYFKTAEDLLKGYRDIAKRIDAELPKLFGRLPRNPYGVREMPAFMAPTSPVAFYYPGSIRSGTAGFFVASTYDLPSKPSWGMVSLTIHEAVPGHHLQVALADELENVHEMRRQQGFTSFVEGWALYSEQLGLEVGSPGGDLDPFNRGLYANPYDDFGRLGDEMWRACRLVIDTGLHAKGWTRDQAVQYMAENSAEPLPNIENEVDRYIGWPGQATAYKIGQLKISELRARATKALGDRFDLRAFHDEILGAGALPMAVLERRIDRWIERAGKAR